MLQEGKLWRDSIHFLFGWSHLAEIVPQIKLRFKLSHQQTFAPFDCGCKKRWTIGNVVQVAWVTFIWTHNSAQNERSIV